MPNERQDECQRHDGKEETADDEEQIIGRAGGGKAPDPQHEPCHKTGKHGRDPRVQPARSRPRSAVNFLVDGCIHGTIHYRAKFALNVNASVASSFGALECRRADCDVYYYRSSRLVFTAIPNS